MQSMKSLFLSPIYVKRNVSLEALTLSDGVEDLPEDSTTHNEYFSTSGSSSQDQQSTRKEIHTQTSKTVMGAMTKGIRRDAGQGDGMPLKTDKCPARSVRLDVWHSQVHHVPAMLHRSRSLDEYSQAIQTNLKNGYGRTFMLPTISFNQKAKQKHRWYNNYQKPKMVSSEDINKICGGLNYNGRSHFPCTENNDNILANLMEFVKSRDAHEALKALADIFEQSPYFSEGAIWGQSRLINQRLLEILKSSQIHVARTACQLMGHFFTITKDTRGPEFDDIVNTLLYKTADTNKFMRYDAHRALLAMVNSIPVFDAIRALCARGPTHRNMLVRLSTIRMVTEVVSLVGPRIMMTNSRHEAARKMIITKMIYFLDIRNVEVRRFAMALYNILNQDGKFTFYAVRYLNRTKFESLMASVSNLQKSQLNS